MPVVLMGIKEKLEVVETRGDGNQGRLVIA